MKGFTLLEILVVTAIIGVGAALSFPSIANTMELRRLDLSVRDVSTTFQTARFLAVTTKSRHRVRFWAQGSTWAFTIEAESASGWAAVRGAVPRQISSRFAPVLNLPTGPAVVFDGLGIIDNFDGARNTVTLVSRKLASLNQPSQRIIRLYATGSAEVVTAT